MNRLAQNLVILRQKQGLKQAEIAEKTGIKRNTWSNWENAVAQPSLDDLTSIAQFFDISLDDLITSDLENVHPMGTGRSGKKGQKSPSKSPSNSPSNQVLTAAFRDTERMPHVVTVDREGRENIAYVPIRAKAGYLAGHADPQFISTLPTYNFPGLQNATFRMFEIEGHSMIPTFDDTDIIIGRFVENLSTVRNDRIHVIVTKNDGILVKRVLNRVVSDGKLILNSDNQKDPRDYPPIIVNVEDVIEVWYGVAKFTRQMRPPGEMYNRLIDLEARLTLIEDRVKK